MICPFCRGADSRVIDSRTADDGGAIRRRRQCPECNNRFSTLETVSLMVRKNNDVVEPFKLNKVISGVMKACHGRPVSEADVRKLAQQVEISIRATGASQVDSNDIGLAILDPLRQLDSIAYMRFASVYKNFDSLEDFQIEIDSFRDIDGL